MPEEPACISISISLSFNSSLRSFFAERLARGLRGIGAHQRVEHAVFGGELRLRLHRLPLLLLDETDGDLDQIAHDLLDIASDIADLGEFRRLDLGEGGMGEPWRGAGRSRSCRSRWGRSSGCSSASPRPGSARTAADAASDLRRAIATARLASFWPTMKRSSSETISRGENVVMPGPVSRMEAYGAAEDACASLIKVVSDRSICQSARGLGEGIEKPRAWICSSNDCAISSPPGSLRRIASGNKDRRPLRRRFQMR